MAVTRLDSEYDMLRELAGRCSAMWLRLKLVIDELARCRRKVGDVVPSRLTALAAPAALPNTGGGDCVYACEASGFDDTCDPDSDESCEGCDWWENVGPASPAFPNPLPVPAPSACPGVRCVAASVSRSGDRGVRGSAGVDCCRGFWWVCGGGGGGSGGRGRGSTGNGCSSSSSASTG